MSKVVLVTGFEPFGDYLENISEIAVTQLKNIGDYTVYGIVFPVRIFPKLNTFENYGEWIVKTAIEINAGAIISLGMSSEVKGIRVESRAINWVENHKYCLDNEQRRVVDETFILKKELKVDLDKWHLRKTSDLSILIEKFYKADLNCNFNFSADAGTFCCNALMFRTLTALQKNKCEIPYLFLHTPCSSGAVKNISNWDATKDLMSLEKLTKVLEIILDNLVIEEKAIDVIRRMNPGKFIPTGEELANLIKKQN